MSEYRVDVSTQVSDISVSICIRR